MLTNLARLSASTFVKIFKINNLLLALNGKYAPHSIKQLTEAQQEQPNRYNGYTSKTVRPTSGSFELAPDRSFSATFVSPSLSRKVRSI